MSGYCPDCGNTQCMCASVSIIPEMPTATNHCWPYEKELHEKVKELEQDKRELSLQIRNLSTSLKRAGVLNKELEAKLKALTLSKVTPEQRWCEKYYDKVTELNVAEKENKNLILENSKFRAREINGSLRGYDGVVDGYEAKVKELEVMMGVATKIIKFYSDKDNFCMYEDLSVDEWKYNWIAERPHPQKIDPVGTVAKKFIRGLNQDKSTTCEGLTDKNKSFC